MKYLLTNKKYIKAPVINIKIMYNRISPSVHITVVAKIIKPVKIQNNASSIYVIIFGVLKLFLVILNMSNKMPILIPARKKDSNMYN